MKIIDNINHLLGDDLRETLASTPQTSLKIASSSFSIYAYEALKKQFSDVNSFEFIFTSPTFLPDVVLDKLQKQKREFFIPYSMSQTALFNSEFEIHLRNKLTQKAIARECATWIRKKATFKSNITDRSMQQFICIENDQNSLSYATIDGFNTATLGYQKGNCVSSGTQKTDISQITDYWLGVFKQVWNDKKQVEDVTETICRHIESVYAENAPERVYFMMLYHVFSQFLEEVNEDTLAKDKTGYQNTLIWQKLFDYQKDAANGIINKLETYNGCILADSVGLGKTFTALAVIKYYELRNCRVLVLCPKKLAHNWQNYRGNTKTNIFEKDHLRYDVLCHTDLSRTSGESLGIRLDHINWGNYDLVVIDESHNFRNNDAYKDKETRYQKLMRMVMKEGVKTKVLMLSATPVNNRFTDLRNQLALAYEGDSSILSDKLKTNRSLGTTFNHAQAEFNRWSKLPPEARTTQNLINNLDFDFFEVLDSVTIARSRKHIQSFYNSEAVGRFPTRLKPLSFQKPLTPKPEVHAFNAIFETLSLLKMAVYAPISYILPTRLKEYQEKYDTKVSGGKSTLRQKDREKSLQRLMTTNLLKRLESSVQAFRLTLTALKSRLDTTLQKIDQFQKTGQTTDFDDVDVEEYESMVAEDNDFPDWEDFNVGGKIQVNLKDMDVMSWKADLLGDVGLIDGLLDNMAQVTPTDDSKLIHLKDHILHKVNNPLNPNNRKVLIFTAFADTADYLYQNLAPILKEHSLHTAKVIGTGSPQTTIQNRRKGYDFHEVLTLFSPVSKEKALLMPHEAEEIDILIATDCISEGQNLQDCDYLINYDIHWNPVRIIQRFGRIDRIGSKNEKIQLVNYWPDLSLDEYINLKDRVESRMVIADVTATADDNLLVSQTAEGAYRKEQLRKLKEEVIELEDAKQGVSITDLGLNDFRMELLTYLKEHPHFEKTITKGLHAIIPAVPQSGLYEGVIFVLKNLNTASNIPLQNRLHPYYAVYIDKQGNVLGNHTEVKKVLDLARLGAKLHSEPLHPLCDLFNKATQDGNDMRVYSMLLNKVIQSIINVQEEKDIDSLFSGTQTTALTHSMTGLDDFELIAFLVVQGQGE